MAFMLVAALAFTTVALVRGSVIASVVGLTTVGGIVGVWLSYRIGSRRRIHG